jgi:hypothetical protein
MPCFCWKPHHNFTAGNWNSESFHIAPLTPPPPRLPASPDIDHTFWGRPEDQPVGGALRPVYVWNRTQAAADLLGTVRRAVPAVPSCAS